MERIHDHNPDAKNITTIVVHVLEYKRSPEAFLNALRNNTAIRANESLIGDRAKLIASQQDRTAISNYLKTNGVVWPDGKSLMNPGQLRQLKPRHVICTAEFLEIVFKTISTITNRCKQGIKLKRRKCIAISSG